MNFPYQKLQGCENAYYFMDLISFDQTLPPSLELEDLARQITSDQPAGEADGLIVLFPALDQSQADARMRTFNKDGSEAEMCGNGIRALAKLLYESHGQNASYRIETAAGLREVFIEDHSQPETFQVRVNMGRPSFLPAKIPVEFDDVMVMNEDFEALDREFKLSCVSMGNPHAIVEIDNLESFDVARYGEFISQHEVFPQSCNVNFFEIRDRKVLLRTYERGSAETKACGTGACATAVTLIMQKRFRDGVEIQTRGGPLMIEWDGLREVWMTGDAVTLAKGEYEYAVTS